MPACKRPRVKCPWNAGHQSYFRSIFEQDHLVQHPLLEKDQLRSRKRKKGFGQVTQ